jgi:hypothetical protein
MPAPTSREAYLCFRTPIGWRLYLDAAPNSQGKNPESKLVSLMTVTQYFELRPSIHLDIKNSVNNHPHNGVIKDLLLSHRARTDNGKLPNGRMQDKVPRLKWASVIHASVIN